MVPSCTQQRPNRYSFERKDIYWKHVGWFTEESVLRNSYKPWKSVYLRTWPNSHLRKVWEKGTGAATGQPLPPPTYTHLCGHSYHTGRIPSLVWMLLVAELELGLQAQPEAAKDFFGFHGGR